MPLFPDIGQGYDRQDTPDREDLVIEGEGKFVDVSLLVLALDGLLTVSCATNMASAMLHGAKGVYRHTT